MLTKKTNKFPRRNKITEPFDAVDLAEVFGGCAACGNPNHKPTQPGAVNQANPWNTRQAQ